MAKTAVKSPGARRGRPPLRLGSPKRSSFNTRLSAEIKQQLETEAQIAGRSLSEEIEFRLRQSLQQEADSGGRLAVARLNDFGGPDQETQQPVELSAPGIGLLLKRLP